MRVISPLTSTRFADARVSVTGLAIAAACAVATTACSPPPSIEYAHLLEQAASWAAAATFADEAGRRGDAPRAFTSDLLNHAVEDLESTRASIDSLHVEARRRETGAALCRAIADAMRQSADGSIADPAALRRLELQARTLAAEARGATPP
jgi:hypothetical protein